MMNETVSTIMTRNVKTVGPLDNLSDVMMMLETMKIHHVPVVDDSNQLLGIVTTYDLLRSDSRAEDFPLRLVADYMTKKVATLDPDSKVGTACELFILNKFHALPITEGNTLVGIVTSHDVLKYTYRKEYPEEYQRIF